MLLIGHLLFQELLFSYIEDEVKEYYNQDEEIAVVLNFVDNDNEAVPFHCSA